MKQEIPLDGIWRFAPDPWDEGEHLGWHLPDHDSSRWRDVTVPTVLDRCGPGMEGYHGAAWFRRTIFVPEDWGEAGNDLRFDCDAASNQVALWVNGEEIVEARGNLDFLPFGASIRKWLIPNRDNTFILRVDSRRLAEESAGRNYSTQPAGGILRPLRLTCLPPLSLTPHPALSTKLLSSDRGFLQVEVPVEHHGPTDGDSENKVCVHLRVTDAAGQEVLTDISAPITWGTESTALVPFACLLSPVILWSPAHPYLYTAELTLLEKDSVRDATRIRFGFRSVSVQEGRLCLNGEPVLLYGFNYYSDSPRTDAAADPELVRQDLLRIKESGANLVRLCHHPHDESTLDLCDELGLLTMAEIAENIHIEGLEGQESPQAAIGRREAAERQLTALIRRDQHHPCLIAWSVCRESAFEAPTSDAAEDIAILVRFAKFKDATRLATHISSRWTETPDFDSDDLISVYAYPTWNAHRSSQPHYAAAEAGNWWVENLARLHERYPDKPILVTALGYPALKDVHDGNASEEAQAKVLGEELAGILRCPSISGVIVQCWADNPWVEIEDAHSEIFAPLGVVTRERESKTALETVTSAFKGRTHRPSLVLRRPNLEELPTLETLLPEGYSLRTREEGDLPGLTALMVRAYPELTWDDERVHQALVVDTTVKTTFLITYGTEVVATASARWQPDRYLDEGYVHWVASDPSHRGKQLGLLATLATLHEFQRWGAKGSVLHTDDFRLPAIKVYLKLGFRPVLSHATHAPRWAKLRPALAPSDIAPLQARNHRE